jgi:hypothetical protein
VVNASTAIRRGLAMTELRAWLEEKGQRGVKDVRVASVLAKLDEAQKENGDLDSVTLDLVGTAEAANYLGIERPRIARYLHKNPDMPQPRLILLSTPLWFRDDFRKLRRLVNKRRRAPSNDVPRIEEGFVDRLREKGKGE